MRSLSQKHNSAQWRADKQKSNINYNARVEVDVLGEAQTATNTNSSTKLKGLVRNSLSNHKT
jgi:hypothetical protein